MWGEASDERSASRKGEDVEAESSASYVGRFHRGCRNRESHDEVASLAAELRRAYVAKEQRAQVEEKRAREYAERTSERECAALAQRRCEREAFDEGARRRADALRASEEYRRQLDEQLTCKRAEGRARAEEAREYRRTLEEMDRAQEERERAGALERRREHAERAQRERLVLERAREIRRREERETEEAKHRRDLEYARLTEERSREEDKMRRERAVRRENALLELARVMLDAEARERERQERLIELVAEEMRREVASAERERAKRGRRMRQELAAGLEEQMILAERDRRRYAEEDRAWVDEVMKRIMEDERVARCTAAARCRMKAQYRQDLEGLIAHRRRIREEELAVRAAAVEEERRRERLEVECARRERQRLLAVHAADVAEFVNRATLTADERRILAELTKENRNTGIVDDDGDDNDGAPTRT